MTVDELITKLQKLPAEYVLVEEQQVWGYTNVVYISDEL